MRVLTTYESLVRQQVRLLGGRSLYRVVEGERVHYFEVPGRGNAGPVVLMHGLGASGSSFIRILSGLRRTWSRIYIPDLPGHGSSPMDMGRELRDARGHGMLVFHFIEQIVREPVVLIGNSMGGGLAAGLAIERPHLIRGVAMLSPAGSPLSAAELHELRARFILRRKRDAARFMRNLTHKSVPVTYLAAADMREQMQGPAVRQILERLPEDSVNAAALRALTIPMLLIWGESEKILPTSAFEFYRQNLPPHARIEMFENCGHVPMLEQPKRTLELLDALARDVLRQERESARAPTALAG